MKRMLCLLSLFVCCSSGIGIPHTIQTQAGQDWLADDAKSASDFWYEHGIIFEPIEQGVPDISIVVDNVLTDTNYNAIAYWDGLNSIGYIHMDETMPLYGHGYQVCVLAHELGHALGMSHVKDKHSLMSEDAQDVNETFCPWSKYDQAEFERVVH